MKRAFRGSSYDIQVQVGRGPTTVTLDGRPHASTLLPAFGDGRTHAVSVKIPRG